MLWLQWLGMTVAESQRNAVAPTPKDDPLVPSDTGMKPLSAWKLTLWVLLAVLVIALLISFFAFVLRNDPFPWNLQQKLSPSELGQVVQASVTTAAALGLGVTLLLSFRRQRTAEETQRTAEANHTTTLALLQLQQEQHNDARIASLREQQAQASEHLGNSAAAVQLAGVHSMASIIDSWRAGGYTQDVQAGINVLTGYRRMAEFSEKPDVAIAMDAAWSAVTNRLRDTVPESERWKADIDFRGITIPAEGVRNLVVDGIIVTFADSSVVLHDDVTVLPAQTVFEHTIVKRNGVLDFSGAHLVSSSLVFLGARFFLGDLRLGLMSSAGGHLRFTGCKFFMTRVSVPIRKAGTTRITFKDCTFEGGFLSFLGAESLDTVQFLNCKFKKDVEVISPKPRGKRDAPDVKVVIDSQCVGEGFPRSGGGFVVDDQRESLKV